MWLPTHVDAFQESKRRLGSFVRLAHPDPAADISLTTDASDVMVGAVLSQGPHQEPLGFFSKKLTEAERKKKNPCVVLSSRRLSARPGRQGTFHSSRSSLQTSGTCRAPRTSLRTHCLALWTPCLLRFDVPRMQRSPWVKCLPYRPLPTYAANARCSVHCPPSRRLLLWTLHMLSWKV